MKTNFNISNFKLIKNEDININIDKRILPLFSTPFLLQKLSEKKKNKYSINLINPQNNFNSQNQKITLKEILEIFLKGIKTYNLNLKEYLEKHNNKLNLILELKKDDYYKLNYNLSHYFYQIKRFIPVLKLRSLLYNFRLFLPKRLLKPEPFIRLRYRLRCLTKTYKITLNKREIKILRREINRILNKGDQIKIEINNQINNKKNLIKKLEIEEKKKEMTNLLLSKINKQNVIKESSVPVQKKNKIFLLEKKKLFIKNLFKSLNLNNTKTNEIKKAQTMKSILKNNAFDCKTDTISANSNPIAIFNSSDNKPIINQYLKSMSIYNMSNNGIFISYSNIISFNFKNETNKLIKNIYKLLAASFKSMYCLISKPVFVITPDKIIIQLFYFLFIPNILKFKKIHKYGNISKSNLSKMLWFKRKKRIKKQYRKFRKIKINVRIKLRKLSNIVLTKIFTNKFKKLCDLLSHLFKKPVQLDLIRLHYPYKDSHILVNLLGIMINKIKLRIIFRKLFEKAVIKKFKKFTGKTNLNLMPAFLSGIHIKVAGRLLTHRVIPRKTVKTIKRGAIAHGKINFYDVARFTNKNKRGAYSITVLSGQNFFNN